MADGRAIDSHAANVDWSGPGRIEQVEAVAQAMQKRSADWPTAQTIKDSDWRLLARTAIAALECKGPNS